MRRIHPTWLKQVWATGRRSVLSLCMRVILMVMSLVPPTGTRSLPVVNSRNFFCSSSLYASRTLKEISFQKHFEVQSSWAG